MLLRFEVGAYDGHEEVSDLIPQQLEVTPEAHVYSSDGVLEGVRDGRSAAYRLVEMDQEMGVAIYEPLS